MSVSLKMPFYRIPKICRFGCISPWLDRKHEERNKRKVTSIESSFSFNCSSHMKTRKLYRAFKSVLLRSKTVGRDLFLLKQNMKHETFIIGKMHKEIIRFPIPKTLKRTSNGYLYVSQNYKICLLSLTIDNGSCVQNFHWNFYCSV